MLARLILISGIVMSTVLHAQPAIEWSHHFDTGYGEKMSDMTWLSDSTILCVGLYDSTWDMGFHGSSNAMLAGFSANGELIWTRRYSLAPLNWFHCACALPDGGALVGGGSGTYEDPDHFNGTVVRVDAAGELIWVREFAWQPYTWTTAIVPRADGDFDACFVTTQFAGQESAVMMDITAEGDSLWTRGLDLPIGTVVECALRRGDGNLILGAFAEPTQWFYATMAALVDPNGNVLWWRVPELPSAWFAPIAGALAPDDGLLLAGYHNMGGAGTDLFMVRHSNGGDVLWTRQLDLAPSEHAIAVRPYPSGGYLMGGFVSDGANARSDGSIVRVDEEGRAIWNLALTGARNEQIDAILFDAAGHAIVGGATNSFADTSGDLMIARLGIDTATAGLVTRITDNGPPVWGFAVTHSAGVLARFGFAGVPGGTIYGTSGNAQAWTAPANGDGNDGDSIIFSSAIPLQSGAIDTFWISLPDGWCSVHWFAGLASGDIQLDHGGTMLLLGGDATADAWSLHRDSGNLAKVVFGPLPSGSSGSVAGVAANNWHVLENGDGNNGDSVVFVANTPDSTAVLDTFWVTHGDACAIRWSVGCLSDTADAYLGYVRDFHLTARFGPGPDTLRLTTSEESFLGEIQIVMHGIPPQVLATFVPHNDEQLHEYMAIDTVEGWRTYYPRTIDQRGCARDWTELSVHPPADARIDPRVVLDFALSSYPNPFNPSTTISLTVPQTARTTVMVYDLLGRQVKTLQDGVLERGEHQFVFDASALPSGLYFARVNSGEFVATRKMLMLK
jgi:hypothetical protein